MSWRHVPGALAAVLLPVPLMLLFFAMRWNVPDRTAPRVSPVLSEDVRRGLVTYLRRCESSADCEAPMGCLDHWRLKVPTCTDSQCVYDEDCGEGYTCQIFKTEGDGPRVRLCVTQGRLGEGARCADRPENRNNACEPGLRCFMRFCGRPCSPERPESCPEGFFCQEDALTPTCLPTCTERGCPEGQQCIQLETRASQPVSACFAVVHGTNCQQTPCPEGQWCFQQDVHQRQGEVWMSCVQSCGDGHPACPEGFACDIDFCRRLCDPDEEGACGPGLLCARRAPDRPWMCRPDYWRGGR